MSTGSNASGQTDSSDFSRAIPIWFIASRAVIVFLIMLCGVIGNGLVLLVYRRDMQKQSGAVYIITFAVLDIIVCVVLLPQYPIYELAETYDYHLVDAELLKAEGRLQCLCYLFVQVTMALDQFLAVFYPFRHMKLRSTLNKGMLVVFVVLVTLIGLLRYVLPVLVVYQHFYVLIVAFLSSMLILLAVYPAVALKLYRQGRAIRPSNSRISAAIELQTAASVAKGTGLHGAAAGTGTGCAAGIGTHGAAAEAERRDASPAAADAVRASRNAGVASQATAQTQHKVSATARRAMHVQAMKIYTSLFVVFLISFWPLAAAAQMQDKMIGYLYYMNHTVNPIIYYCFVAKFRQSVKEYWRRLTAR